MEPITEQDVCALVEAWFAADSDKAPLDEQQRFFAPGVVIDTWAGATVPLGTQVALHEGLSDDAHVINCLSVAPRADGRVRAIAEVTREATMNKDGGRIVADAGEDWTIERGPDGRCRFASYLTSRMRYRPGSAVLDL